VLKRRVVAESEFGEQQRVELRLQRTHADEMAIGAGIAAIPVRPVEQAAAALERLLPGTPANHKAPESAM